MAVDHKQFRAWRKVIILCHSDHHYYTCTISCVVFTYSNMSSHAIHAWLIECTAMDAEYLFCLPSYGPPVDISTLYRPSSSISQTCNNDLLVKSFVRCATADK